MNGYTKRTEQKRTAIIKAAQELFAQQGVSAVRITDIAARAGVSRVTIFKYFEDKDTLAKEAMVSWIGLLISEYEGIVKSDMPFYQKLLKLASTKLAGREKIGEQYIHTTAWDDPQLMRLIGELTAAHTLPIIMRFLDDGKQSGDIDPALDNEAIMAYFSAFGPIIKNPEYIKKGKAFQTSMFDLFMGGLIRNWYSIKENSKP